MSVSEPCITCPVCDRTSYNPYDIAFEYCGNCNQYHRDMPSPPLWAENKFGHSDCYSHCKSERITWRTFVICFECGHVWTRWSLWRAWVKMGKDLRKPSALLALNYPYSLSSYARLRWAARRWLTRPGRIYFCQECVHDF